MTLGSTLERIADEQQRERRIRLRSAARPTDPVTSFEAADKANLMASQAEVLRVLAEQGPLTDVDIVRFAHQRVESNGTKVNWSDSRLRSARSELRDKGAVRDTGERYTPPSGRRQIIWALTERGRGHA